MKYLIIVVTLLLAGCYEKIPAQEVSVVQGAYQVGKLFTVDGCTVYRFQDNGYNRYFTNCSGSTQWSEHSGKTTRPMGVN